MASFREKPDRAKAEEFLAAGRFYWNSGIFVWKAATILDAIERFEPSISKSLAKLKPSVGTAKLGRSAGRRISRDEIDLDRLRRPRTGR